MPKTDIDMELVELRKQEKLLEEHIKLLADKKERQTRENILSPENMRSVEWELSIEYSGNAIMALDTPNKIRKVIDDRGKGEDTQKRPHSRHPSQREFPSRLQDERDGDTRDECGIEQDNDGRQGQPPYHHPPGAPNEHGRDYFKVVRHRSTGCGFRIAVLEKNKKCGMGSVLIRHPSFRIESDQQSDGYYVPISHEARYFFCSGVSLSILIPIAFSLRRAISVSMSCGTE